MVRKLFKYDFITLIKRMAVAYILVLGTSVLNRLIQFAENPSTWYGIAFGSSVFLVVIALIAMLALTMVFIVHRFYQHYFTGEGYLTFTLPATVDAHLVSNLLANLAIAMLSVAVAFAALCITTSGEVFAELVRALNYVLKEIGARFGTGHIVLLFVEMLIFTIVATCNSFMLFNTCVTLGQRASKHRVAAAVVIYFVYYFICQTVGTMFIILVALTGWDLLDNIMTAIFDAGIYGAHFLIWIGIVLSALMALVYYFLMRQTMKKHLNLE